MTDTSISPQQLARAMKLRYIPSGSKGFRRAKKGNGFIYRDQQNRVITDPEVLERIKDLAIPPAWTDVWISPLADSHLQATGIDAKGRKQYRYHNTWSRLRNDQKFDRILEFGKKLPALRNRIKKDIRQKTLTKTKVIAIALRVMDETFIRAGNTSYEKEYGSYGLTTLKNKHVRITPTQAFFKFKGKKGIQQEIKLQDRSLVRLLRNVKELPGQELFQYRDEDGIIKKLDSGDINEYLQEHMHQDFTCKDFRTWAGCVLALQLMALHDDFECDADCKRNIISIIDGVALRLGNTRAVSRKYYIHPQLITAYEKKKLEKIIRPLKKEQLNGSSSTLAESSLLKFLRSSQP